MTAEQPEETRGGEVPGDWKVAASAAARAAAVRAQSAVTENYLEYHEWPPEDNAG